MCFLSDFGEDFFSKNRIDKPYGRNILYNYLMNNVMVIV